MSDGIEIRNEEADVHYNPNSVLCAALNGQKRSLAPGASMTGKSPKYRMLHGIRMSARKNVGTKGNSHNERFKKKCAFPSIATPLWHILKNRIAKSAMSDSLGDGCGGPTDAQIRLYERWADDGLALLIIGEVQGTPDFAEKPGNFVLNAHSDPERFRALARQGSINNAHLWLQLGNARAKPRGAILSRPGSDT